jgi:hypothetical protein
MSDANEMVWLHNRPVTRAYYEQVRADVDAAPPLTAEQRQTLRALLRPLPDSAARPTNQVRHRNGEPVANAGHHVDVLPHPPPRNRGRHRDT